MSKLNQSTPDQTGLGSTNQKQGSTWRDTFIKAMNLRDNRPPQIPMPRYIAPEVKPTKVPGHGIIKDIVNPPMDETDAQKVANGPAWDAFAGIPNAKAELFKVWHPTRQLLPYNNQGKSVDEVKKIQQMLEVKDDGMWGAKTQFAWEMHQRQQALAYNPQTFVNRDMENERLIARKKGGEIKKEKKNYINPENKGKFIPTNETKRPLLKKK